MHLFAIIAIGHERHFAPFHAIIGEARAARRALARDLKTGDPVAQLCRKRDLGQHLGLPGLEHNLLCGENAWHARRVRPVGLEFDRHRRSCAAPRQRKTDTIRFGRHRPDHIERRGVFKDGHHTAPVQRVKNLSACGAGDPIGKPERVHLTRQV